MRLRILHEITCDYAPAANRTIHTLRLSPRGHEGQFVAGWRVEVDQPCRLDSATDAFGNTVQSFSLDGPLEKLVISAQGEVETEETHGIMRGQVERFPLDLYLRETAATEPDAALRELAQAAAAQADTLGSLHDLMRRIHVGLRHESDGKELPGTAAEALKAGKGSAGDFAHIFITAARHLGIPARYVSGYRWPTPAADSSHGWAEAYAPGIGWIGFDSVHDMSPTEAYVRLAVGLDYLGAAPIRGTRYGGGTETVTTRVVVEEVGSGGRQGQGQGQVQNQS